MLRRRYPDRESCPTDLTNAAAVVVNSGSTHRGGERWIEIFPPNVPKMRCMSGERIFSGLPARSLPSALSRIALCEEAAIARPFHQHERFLLSVENPAMADVEVA